MADEESKSQQQDRQYMIRFVRELDLADSACITKLRDEFGKDQTIEVLVSAGNVVKKTPKEAVAALGQKRDLDGAIEVVSGRAVNRFEVKVEQKRAVTIT